MSEGENVYVYFFTEYQRKKSEKFKKLFFIIINEFVIFVAGKTNSKKFLQTSFEFFCKIKLKYYLSFFTT